jgi:hypothetical protein
LHEKPSPQVAVFLCKLAEFGLSWTATGETLCEFANGAQNRLRFVAELQARPQAEAQSFQGVTRFETDYRDPVSPGFRTFSISSANPADFVIPPPFSFETARGMPLAIAARAKEESLRDE